MTQLEDLLDAKQVKKILRCSLPLVYRMAERGNYPVSGGSVPGMAVAKRRWSDLRWRQLKLLSRVTANKTQIGGAIDYGHLTRGIGHG